MCVSRDKSERSTTLVIATASNGNNILGSVLTLRNDNITCYEKLSDYVEKTTHTELVFFLHSLSMRACRFYRCFLADLTECCRCCYCCCCYFLIFFFIFRFQYLHLCMYLCVVDMCFFFIQSVITLFHEYFCLIVNTLYYCC